MASHLLVTTIAAEFIRGGCVVEIGSSREIERKEKSSTHFFKKTCELLDSMFFSVDISEKSHALAQTIVGNQAVCTDGETFLKNFRHLTRRRISVLYLDNFDVIYNDQHEKDLRSRVGEEYGKWGWELENSKSAEVHLSQMKAAIPLMAQRSVVICDDTMTKNDGWWGKGATVVPYLLAQGWRVHSASDIGVMLTSPRMKHPETPSWFSRRRRYVWGLAGPSLPSFEWPTG